MPDKSKIINSLLKLEVASKSSASSLSFVVFSIFSYLYHYGTVEYAWIVKICSVILFFTNITRYIIIKKINVEQVVSDNRWRMLAALIMVNAICWSVIFNLATFESKISGIHFIVVTTMLTGFIASSIVTLSYFTYLFLPFQLLLIGPQLILIAYFYFSPDHINLTPLIFLYTAYCAYQAKQFKDFRKEFLKRFNYQIDLELANNELKESKDELIEQTNKLMHVSRLAALGEMSVGIAHEINNPLTIMKGGAQLIEKHLQRDPLDKEAIIKQTQKIQNAVTRVTTIIKGLKDLSNLSDAREPEVISLEQILSETSEFCSEILRAHGIDFIQTSSPDCKISCHPVQISQVLINLIKNAQDFIVKNSSDSDKRWIKLECFTENKIITIKVSNSGEKIPQELASKIFEAFFTTKPKGEGTGLGLSISQKIVTEHKGKIYLDQNSNYTTFVLEFPIFNQNLG